MKTAFCLIAALGALAAAGCTTDPVRDSETRPVPVARILAPQYLAAAAGTGEVAVKRDPGFMSGGCKMELLVDELPIADLARRERIEIHVPAGDHVLGVRPKCPLWSKGLSEVTARVTPDEPLSFRIGVTDSGNAFILPTRF